MRVRFRPWWQKLKQHWVAFGVGAIVFVVVIVIIIIGYQFDWTGFKGKTVWDWLQLLGVLAIPVVVGFGAAWFTRVQQQRDQRLAREQHDYDQVLAEQRTNSEREAAEKRAQTEREIASDNQREAALQAYIDKLAGLLLVNSLRKSEPGDEVRTIARIRTVTVVQGLDPIRKRILLIFLHESELIKKDGAIVELWGTIFNRADLRGIDLRNADLHRTSLSSANLSGTLLSGADLNGANLAHANFSDTDLSSVNVKGAYLNGANLKGAILTDEQLAQVGSLKGATMPDGSIHP